MSLFEDSRFVYRDTFFVFFQQKNRPSLKSVESMLAGLGDKYESSNARESAGKFDSITVHSPQDYSAMDITYIDGEEVRDQIQDLKTEFRTMTLTGDDHQKIADLEKCDGRLDVFHFAELSNEEVDEDEVLDPGGLLLVLERLARLSNGVSYDPQSQSLL